MVVEAPCGSGEWSEESTGKKVTLATQTRQAETLWQQPDVFVGRVKKFCIPLSASCGQKYVLCVRSLSSRPAFMCSVTLRVNGPDSWETFRLLKGAKAEGDSGVQLSFEIPAFHQNQVIEAVVELASMNVFARARVSASISFADSVPSRQDRRGDEIEEAPSSSEESPCEVEVDLDDFDEQTATTPDAPATNVAVGLDSQQRGGDDALDALDDKRHSTNLFVQILGLRGRQDSKGERGRGKPREEVSAISCNEEDSKLGNEDGSAQYSIMSPAPPCQVSPPTVRIASWSLSPEEGPLPAERRSSWTGGEQKEGEARATASPKKGERGQRWWGGLRRTPSQRMGKTSPGAEGADGEEAHFEGASEVRDSPPQRRSRLLFRGGRSRDAPGEADAAGDGEAAEAGAEEEREETIWREEKRVPAKGLKGEVVLTDPGRFRFSARTLAPRILPNRAMGYVVTVAASKAGHSIELSAPEFLHAEDYFLLRKEDLPARVSWSIWSHAIFNTSTVSASLQTIPNSVAAKLPPDLQWLLPSKDGGSVEEVVEETEEKDLVQQLQQPLAQLNGREAVQPVLLVLLLCLLSWLNQLASVPLIYIPLFNSVVPSWPVSLRGVAAVAAAGWCHVHREEVGEQLRQWQRDFANWRRVKKLNRRARELREKMQGKGVWGKVKLMRSEFMRTQHEQQLNAPASGPASAGSNAAAPSEAAGDAANSD